MIELLLTLILGLAIGFYGRKLIDYVRSIYEMLQYKFDSHRAGVVKPEVIRTTKSQPIDLSSNTGGVRRPSPNQVALDYMKQREQNIRDRTP